MAGEFDTEWFRKREEVSVPCDRNEVEAMEWVRPHGERDAASRDSWLTALNGQVVTSDEEWDSVERRRPQ